MKTTVLVDVDRTLLDTDKLWRDLRDRADQVLGPQVAARVWKLYEEQRTTGGGLIDKFIPLAARELKIDPNVMAEIFYGGEATGLEPINYQQYLYEGSKEFIEELKRGGYQVVLYSNGSVKEGNKGFQWDKIGGLGLGQDAVICAEDKVAALEAYRDLLSGEVVHIDDNEKMLVETKQKLTELGVSVTSIKIDHQDKGFEGVRKELAEFNPAFVEGNGGRSLI